MAKEAGDAGAEQFHLASADLGDCFVTLILMASGVCDISLRTFSSSISPSTDIAFSMISRYSA